MSDTNLITESEIMVSYMNFLEKNKEKPASIQDFCSILDIEEEVFLNYFDSFKSVEKLIFLTLFENTLVVLKSSEEYYSFDRRNQVLSLYFTFFENLNLNRDSLLIIIKSYNNQIESLAVLTDLKKQFLIFMEELEIEKMSIKIEGVATVQRKVILESTWVQFLLILKFWLSDTSSDMEKTDVFIEKSINTGFDLLDNSFLKSAIDLGKFLYKEKFQN